MEGEWRNQRNTDEERTRRKSLRQRKPWCPFLRQRGRATGGYGGKKDRDEHAPGSGLRSATYQGREEPVVVEHQTAGKCDVQEHPTVASSRSCIAVQAIRKRSAERNLATSRSNTTPASSRSLAEGIPLAAAEAWQLMTTKEGNCSNQVAFLLPSTTGHGDERSVDTLHRGRYYDKPSSSNSPLYASNGSTNANLFRSSA